MSDAPPPRQPGESDEQYADRRQLWARCRQPHSVQRLPGESDVQFDERRQLWSRLRDLESDMAVLSRYIHFMTDDVEENGHIRGVSAENFLRGYKEYDFKALSTLAVAVERSVAAAKPSEWKVVVF